MHCWEEEALVHPHDLDFMNAPTGSCTGLQEVHWHLPWKHTCTQEVPILLSIYVFCEKQVVWARAHFVWAALKLVNGTISPSLWPTINVLRGGEQSRDGAFLQIQPFSFQTHLLSHHWFLVVAVTGKVKAAKSGRGGRPCPVRTMYTYSFRAFAGEWCVCGKLVQRYSIVWRTSVSTLRLCSDTAWLFLIDLTASSDIVQWNLSKMVTV